MHSARGARLRGAMKTNLTHTGKDAAPAAAGRARWTDEFASRLATLGTGQPGLRSLLPVTAAGKAPPSSEPGTGPGTDDPAAGAREPVIDFTASDETLDRAGEVIVAGGWRLENFRRNPVFQNAHNYGNVLHTLGRALTAEVREGRLFLRVLFATEINPVARLAYEMYRAGFLRAVSVGFVPVRWENGGEHTPYRRRFLEQELLEVSAVAVPANPNALALGLKSGAVATEDLRELRQLLQAALAALPLTKAGSEPAALLALARATARALRRL